MTKSRDSRRGFLPPPPSRLSLRPLMLVQRFPNLVNLAERGLHVVLQLECPLDDGVVLLHLALQLLQAVGQQGIVLLLAK